MDQDEQQQACMMPAADAAPVCAAPADGGSVDGASGVAPAAGDSSNPVLAQVSAAAPPVVSKEEKDAGDQLDGAGKAMDFLGTAAKFLKSPFGAAAEEAGGKIGGAASMPGDIMATASGVDEMRKGDMQNGVIDTGIGGAGIVADAASIAGDSPVANVANAVKGGLEIGKGAGQLIDAATAGPIAPGQSGVDRADETVNGIENLLKGVGDGSQAFGPEAAALGKSLNYGMAAGNAIAPYVFDEKQASNAQTADGQYHGSTGNNAVDWVFGIGKYSNGRMHDSSADNK